MRDGETGGLQRAGGDFLESLSDVFFFFSFTSFLAVCSTSWQSSVTHFMSLLYSSLCPLEQALQPQLVSPMQSLLDQCNNRCGDTFNTTG